MLLSISFQIVIIEIILGFLAGKFLFEDLSEESFLILDFLALFGFLFLMFLSGLAIDVDQIIASFPRRQLTWVRFLKNPLLVGITQFILAVLFSYLVSLLLAQIIEMPKIWYFSLILITTSVAIVLPVLKGKGETGSRFGQMIIMAAAVADILSIILFTFTAYILKNGFHFKLVYFLVLFILFSLFYKIILKLKNIQLLKKLGSCYCCF